MAFLRDKSVFCIPIDILSSRDRYIIGGICIATSSLGFTGAYLQLKTLWQYRDRQRRKPSANPRIIFYLAIADLVACLGIFALSICLMLFEPPTMSKTDPDHFTPQNDNIYAPIGTTIEVFTLFSYLASYLWTFAFALDICFQIYGIDCSMVVYHILAWFIPLEIVTTVEVLNYVEYPSYCEKFYQRISRLILSYVPVMVIVLVNPFLFLITYRKVKILLRTSGRYTSIDRAALNMCKKKFLWMVFVFTVCWFPNIISVSYDLATLTHNQTKKSELDNLWFLEAFVNPLQGIFNYFVYRNSFRVTATDTRRTRDSLPRVSQSRSYRRYEQSHKQSKTLSKLTVQRNFDSAATTTDEETPLIGSSRSIGNSTHSDHSYVTRLLGE